MKRVVLLAAIMFMLSCGNEIETKDGLFKGAVRSVTTTTYTAEENFGKLTSGDIISTMKREYNEAGYIMRREYYEEGEFQYDYRWEYDDNNNKITFTSKTESNHTEYREDYEYNSNGDEVSCKVWDIDGGFENLRINIIHEYDQDNNCVSENTYLDDGSLYKKIASDYEDGVLVKSATYEEGVLSDVDTYDDSGHILNTKRYIMDIPSYLTSNKYLDKEINFNYDNKGKLITQTMTNYNSPGDALLVNSNYPQESLLNSKAVTIIDENGLDVRTEYTKYEGWVDPEIDYTAVLTTTYDEYLNVLEIRTTYSFKDEPNIDKNVYKYDDHNNWVERIYTNSQDSNKNSIVKKTIVYYK